MYLNDIATIPVNLAGNAAMSLPVGLAPEDGIPVPCAQNQPWVNEDTQQTLRQLRIPRTDPWGKPLPGEPDDGIAARMNAAVGAPAKKLERK